MSAIERHKLQQSLSTRVRVLDEIKRSVSVAKWLSYAAQHDLPSDPGRCSTDQLEQAWLALQPQGVNMALKGGAKIAKAAQTIQQSIKIFLVTWPESQPQKASAIVMVGDEPKQEPGITQVAVASPKELAGMPAKALLALINAGKTGTPIRKMANEDAMVQAAWDALLTRAEAPTPAKESKPRAIKAIAYEPKDKDSIKTVRKGTKVSIGIDMLGRSEGVLLSEFEAELSKTGKPISARAWLSYDVSKVVGYGVRSEPEGENDLRLYLVLPKGMKAPLAHKELEEKPAKAEKPAKETPTAPKSTQTEDAKVTPIAAAKSAAKKAHTVAKEKGATEEQAAAAASKAHAVAADKANKKTSVKKGK